MTFLDRSQINQGADKTPQTPGAALVIGVTLAVLLATLAIRNLLPADALAPAVVTLLFAFGAVTAGAAWLCRSRRVRIMWLDLAGSLTFIGIAISVLIEPDQIAGLFTLSDQPE